MRVLDEIAHVPVRRQFLGLGTENATSNTIEIMRDIINKSATNYYVRRWAEKILQGCDKCPMERAQSLFYFLANNTQYQRDSFGTELLKTPIVSLQLMDIGEIPQLDCDDYVILSLSMYKSLGYPIAIRAISLKPDKALSHVYGLVGVLGRWYAIDLTKPELGFGWEYPKATRVVTRIV